MLRIEPSQHGLCEIYCRCARIEPYPTLDTTKIGENSEKKPAAAAYVQDTAPLGNEIDQLVKRANMGSPILQRPFQQWSLGINAPRDSGNFLGAESAHDMAFAKT